MKFFFLILESTDKEGTKKLKYKCNTTKILQMTRVFLTEKNKIEKGTKEVVLVLLPLVNKDNRESYLNRI